jgi:hypothetical protein
MHLTKNQYILEIEQISQDIFLNKKCFSHSWTDFVKSEEKIKTFPNFVREGF